MTGPALSIRRLIKSYGGVRALSGVDLDIEPGEIHALLGENGAGKSTLIKILAAIVRPDSGAISIAGQALPAGFAPGDVAAVGLRFVHQDLALVDDLSVLENMAFLTGFAKRRGFIDYAATAKSVAAQLAQLGSDIPPQTRVGDLPQAEKAIVALARAMQGEARLVVLDEVTANLPSPDAARVHASVEAAKARGVAFIYVSHRMEEVFGLCDRLTVLADGRNVAAARVADVDLGTVVRWIAGRLRDAPAPRGAAPSDAAPRLVAEALAGARVPGPVSLSVRGGEILGVTGIRGSGYDILCRWLAGLGAPTSGAICIDGVRVAAGSPARMRAAGCDVILGDRAEAAFGDLSLRENLFPDALAAGRSRDPQVERDAAASILDRFGVRPSGASECAMIALSGGNQQKVLFARALDRKPNVLVLVDPTAGVDIGARGELHRLLRKAAADGAAIVLGSSDFEEIADVADRALVMRSGVTAETLEGDALTWERLFAAAHGGEIQHTAQARQAARGR
jgi:ribose transport system ATP-binding protein